MRSTPSSTVTFTSSFFTSGSSAFTRYSFSSSVMSVSGSHAAAEICSSPLPDACGERPKKRSSPRSKSASCCWIGSQRVVRKGLHLVNVFMSVSISGWFGFMDLGRRQSVIFSSARDRWFDCGTNVGTPRRRGSTALAESWPRIARTRRDARTSGGESHAALSAGARRDLVRAHGGGVTVNEGGVRAPTGSAVTDAIASVFLW